MRVWRLCKEKYATTAFSGEGARRYGGRWNHRGEPAVYASHHLSLAALEFLVHLDIDDAPPDLVAIPALIPDMLDIHEVEVQRLPDGWRAAGEHSSLNDLGTEWLEAKRSPVLAVPSAVIPHEMNYVLNPTHDDFSEIEIGDPDAFLFDRRLLQ